MSDQELVFFAFLKRLCKVVNMFSRNENEKVEMKICEMLHFNENFLELFTIGYKILFLEANMYRY